MGNVNCNPASDCINLRPGNPCYETENGCFRTPGSATNDPAGKLKINNGTPEELLVEWN